MKLLHQLLDLKLLKCYLFLRVLKILNYIKWMLKVLF
ncbi:hypothetical protein CsSME_00002390 [Camellia sinensis var. sinensis]